MGTHGPMVERLDQDEFLNLSSEGPEEVEGAEAAAKGLLGAIGKKGFFGKGSLTCQMRVRIA